MHHVAFTYTCLHPGFLYVALSIYIEDDFVLLLVCQCSWENPSTDFEYSSKSWKSACSLEQIASLWYVWSGAEDLHLWRLDKNKFW